MESAASQRDGASDERSGPRSSGGGEPLARQRRAGLRRRHPEPNLPRHGVHRGRLLAARWLDAAPVSGGVLRVFMAAGRGLQAAHAAGLVHGDFKPLSFWVGRDGRARVIDFGLARETDGDAVRTSVPSRGSVPPSSDDSLRGTPRIPGPGTVRARGHRPAQRDQFSFCIATWERVFACSPRPVNPPSSSASRLGADRSAAEDARAWRVRSSRRCVAASA